MIYPAEKTLAHTLITITSVENFVFYVFYFLFHEKSGKNIANLVKKLIYASYYILIGAGQIIS